MRGEHALRRSVVERRAPRQQLVGQTSQRVQVGAVVDRRVPPGLLGRHVGGVPNDMPICVSVPPGASRDAERAFAMPKSVTTAVPPESRTLSGLMSRCTTPRPCANSSARAMSRRMLMTSASDSAAPASSRARSDSPSTKGIVYQGMPFVSPADNTGTMFAAGGRGDLNLPEPLGVDSRGELASQHLHHDRRRRRFSIARKTRDIPPPPSSRSMR